MHNTHTTLILSSIHYYTPPCAPQIPSPPPHSWTIAATGIVHPNPNEQPSEGGQDRRCRERGRSPRILLAATAALLPHHRRCHYPPVPSITTTTTTRLSVRFSKHRHCPRLASHLEHRARTRIRYLDCPHNHSKNADPQPWHQVAPGGTPSPLQTSQEGVYPHHSHPPASSEGMGERVSGQTANGKRNTWTIISSPFVTARSELPHVPIVACPKQSSQGFGTSKRMQPQTHPQTCTTHTLTENRSGHHTTESKSAGLRNPSDRPVLYESHRTHRR